MRSVYLETCIISYLAARPSRDLVNAARQQITWEWWETRRRDFEVYAFDLVLLESSAGDTEAAKCHSDFLRDVPVLEVAKVSTAGSAARLRRRAFRTG